MRDSFHEDLDRISDRLVEMTRLVGSAMSRSTTALLDADLSLAEGVIEADHLVDTIRDEIDEMAVQLIAQQSHKSLHKGFQHGCTSSYPPCAHSWA